MYYVLIIFALAYFFYLGLDFGYKLGRRREREIMAEEIVKLMEMGYFG